MKFNLSIFPFITWAFGVLSKRPLINLRWSTFTLTYSCSSFIISALTFRSFNQIELIFQCNQTILLHVGIQLSQSHTIFPTKWTWYPCENQLTVCLFLGSKFYFIGLCICPYVSTTVFDYCNFVLSFQIEKCVFLLCPFPPRLVLATLDLL